MNNLKMALKSYTELLKLAKSQADFIADNFDIKLISLDLENVHVWHGIENIPQDKHVRDLNTERFPIETSVNIDGVKWFQRDERRNKHDNLSE